MKVDIPAAFSRLSIARKLAGQSRSDLARAIGVKSQTISRWESGCRIPSARDIEKLAFELKCSPIFLIPDDSRTIESEDCNYRSLVRTLASDRRKAEGLGSIFQLLCHQSVVRLGQDPMAPVDIPESQLSWADAFSDFEGGESDDLERLLLSVDPEEEAARVRREWEVPAGPIENVIGLLEQHGALVHRLPNMQAESIDAFSFWTGERPVVLLNDCKKDPFRYRYDACHELAHLVIHSRVPESRLRGKSGNKEQIKQVEQQANRFAGAFLVPAANWILEAPRTTNPWGYVKAKMKWKVSIAALIVRSFHVGVLSKKQYSSAMVRYSMLGWRKNGEPKRHSIGYERPSTLEILLRELYSQKGIAAYTLLDQLGLEPHVGRALFQSNSRKVVNISERRTGIDGSSPQLSSSEQPGLVRRRKMLDMKDNPLLFPEFEKR